MEKIRNILLPIFIFAFLLVCVFDPTDPYHFKLIFYFVSLILGADILIKNLGNKYYLPIYLMGVAYPIVATLWSTALTGSFVAAAQQAYPAALILLVIIIKEKKYDYQKWLLGMLLVMVIVTAIFGILDVLNIVHTGQLSKLEFFKMLKERGIVDIGYRETLCFTASVFFRAGLLITLLLAVAVKRKNWLVAILSTFGLAVSGTRANLAVGCAILGLGVLLLIRDKIDESVEDVSKRKKYKGILIAILLVICIPAGIALIMILHRNDASSDSIKYAQAIGILDILKDPKNFFLGQGFGSYFADMGRDGELYNTAELNYLDFFRKAGLILSIPFFAFIFLPFTWKIDWDKKLALLAYLIIATTNPYLYTSTAFVLYIYIYLNRPEDTWFSRKISVAKK